jgi:rubrerythrin
MRYVSSTSARKGLVIRLAIGVCAVMLVASPAAAGNASGEDSSIRAGGQQEADEQRMKQNVEQLMERRSELQKEITGIRGEAFDSNPELEKRLKKLVEKTNNVMKQYLDDEQVDMQRLQELHKKLNNPDLNATRKSELKKEFDGLYLAYKRAKSKASRNRTVMRMRKDFYEDLFAAMREEDPKVKQKIQELRSLEHRLRYVKREAVPEEMAE